MTQNTSAEQIAFLIAQAAQRKAIQARKRKLKRKIALNHALDRLQILDSLASKTPAPRSPSQLLGDLYEHKAWEALCRAGCHLLARQLQCPLGEIDLVVQDAEILVFVEVRFRSSPRFGGAGSSMTPTKQTRLLRAVHWWLPALVRRHFGGQMPPCRIDLVAFEQDVLNWYPDVVRLNHDQ